ncbi:di-heme oxidoredictase family protein [Reinekea blandensis]|uniref:Predicted thiol oxidoreductase n=1 Tax=Reinekea blandensis MED297 TaxID=314283 RepID=A4BAS6_9GAMM|nr:di-heme oxidoredictase family protein [Reinekea blandensis]EAR10539.1 predicted thiol oxidoreductase [Reinekea sp. MED297] [Reinekea blandensis MED297]
MDMHHQDKSERRRRMWVGFAVSPLAAVLLSSCDVGSPLDNSVPDNGVGNQGNDPIVVDDQEPIFEGVTTERTVALPSSDAPSLPSPPNSMLLPVDYVLPSTASKVTPVAATSSTAANGNNTADKAIDDDLGSRWESASVDDAWIQFDFGEKTAIGSLTLNWEAAHADEYAVYISDDDDTWYQLRYTVGSDGGEEKFFNLKANARYVKLQGIQRATHYGYSIFEAQFASPSLENTVPAMATSRLAYPDYAQDLTPVALENPIDPIDRIQFQLPDGRLVTRFGMMARSRHARERGEEWNEIGYGNNETVDAFGNPQDKGPGAHLNFVGNYFKNRTWGVEFIDNTLVPGVTEPSIVVNQYYQQDQRGGGHSFVRRFDTTGVTGFGWMSPGDLLDDSTYSSGRADCKVVAKPPLDGLKNPNSGYAGVIGANDGCSVVFDRYPRHGKLVADANGVLVNSGETVPSRALVKGDVIEFTGSFFSTREAMDAVGDDGAVRYYTNELTYVMGEGLRPWYGVQPRLMNEPLPEEALQGGLGSVSYDYADNTSFIYQQPHSNIGMENMQRFVEGRRWLHTNLWTGEHNEANNDRNDDGMYLQGPRFNQSSCFGCHINNGRGVAPTVLNQKLDTMAIRVASDETDGNGQQAPNALYGQAMQMNARSLTTGELENWGGGVWVDGFQTKEVALNDGKVVELSQPTYAFEGPRPEVFSVRSAQPLIGMGLLEAIPDDTILSFIKTDDPDGVKGIANLIYDPEVTDAFGQPLVRVGRYGWKAAKVSLRHQVAGAALLDMAVTSPVFPSRACLGGPANCNTTYQDPGLTEDALTLMTQYLHLLAVPAQRSVESGFPKGVTPLPPLDVDPIAIARGETVFTDIRCNACHVMEVQTGNNSAFEEVRNQTIRPYTDLLLHDMGEDLSDKLVEGLAEGRYWRTPALWGIGYAKAVAGDGYPVGFLHDSRARTLEEAIVWHGGEAQKSRDRYVNELSTQQRADLIAFLNSL